MLGAFQSSWRERVHHDIGDCPAAPDRCWSGRPDLIAIRVDFGDGRYRVAARYYSPSEYVLPAPGELEIESVLRSENGRWQSVTWIDCTRRLARNKAFIERCLETLLA